MHHSMTCWSTFSKYWFSKICRQCPSSIFKCGLWLVRLILVSIRKPNKPVSHISIQSYYWLVDAHGQRLVQNTINLNENMVYQATFKNKKGHSAWNMFLDLLCQIHYFQEDCWQLRHINRLWDNAFEYTLSFRDYAI